jgi:hypothetical protein
MNNANLTSFKHGPGVDSSCNRNECLGYFLEGKGGWWVGLRNLSPSCADCLKMWEPQPPGNLRACSGL